jgi:sensor histidine kinase YesM
METGDLELQLAKAQLEALRVRMNPHLISNVLTSIRSLIHKDEKELAIRYLSKFAKFIRSTLDFADREFNLLSGEIEYLGTYLDIEKLRFGNKFSTSIEVAKGLDTEKVMVPPSVFQPYIENAINHGLMHRPEGGKLKVSFSVRMDALICRIEDNGVGRMKALAIESRTRTRHNSYTIRITHERMQLYNKLFNTNKFSVRIKDLTDEHGEASGTRVTISLPLNDVYRMR